MEGRVVMAEDWLKDVRIYDADADEGVVASIVKYCGIALQSRDSSLVAMSDKKERDLVRENYLKKKLGLTDSDESLDEAILSVGQVMKADRTKNRVTVYYLLAKHYGLMNIFGGVAGVAGAAGAAAAVSGLMGKADADVEPAKDEGGSVAPLAAAGLAGAGAAAAAAVPTPDPIPAPEPVAATPSYASGSYDTDVEATGGGMGWLKWLLLALLLAALLFFGLRYCSNQGADAPAADTAATTEVTETVEPAATTEAAPAATAEVAPAAVPEGSGVVASTRDGKPMLTVYFDQAKTNLPTDFDKVAAVIKDYAAKNPGAKFAVSGFNSPTGSAAGNARLSKGRAENVGAALQKLGIAAGSVELVKPADATQGTGEDAKARRVEVTVK
jgi:outer membrane protein OmpA-like peptidoglycan-associated protein